MRSPEHDRSAYLRDCVVLGRIRRRVEESPHMSKGERTKLSEYLRQVSEAMDRSSAKAAAAVNGSATVDGGVGAKR